MNSNTSSGSFNIAYVNLLNSCHLRTWNLFPGVFPDAGPCGNADSRASIDSGDNSDTLDGDAVSALSGLAPRPPAQQLRQENAGSTPLPTQQMLRLKTLQGWSGATQHPISAQLQLTGGRNSSIFRRSSGSRLRSIDVLLPSTQTTDMVRSALQIARSTSAPRMCK